MVGDKGCITWPLSQCGALRDRSWLSRVVIPCLLLSSCLAVWHQVIASMEVFALVSDIFT